jgi:lipopolysaccharide biosynthesis regulator YciM
MEKAPPDFYMPLVLMGRIRMEENRMEEGIGYLKRAMHLSDGYALTACDMLRQFYEISGDANTAESYLEIIRRYNRLD